MTENSPRGAESRLHGWPQFRRDSCDVLYHEESVGFSRTRIGKVFTVTAIGAWKAMLIVNAARSREI